MTTWQPGDPIATGTLLLPRPELKQAYGKACSDAVIDGMVKHVMAGKGRRDRVSRLASLPERLQATVRKKVIAQWSQRQ